MLTREATYEDYGFSEDEMMRFRKLVKANAHLIMEFSTKGGFPNASNF